MVIFFNGFKFCKFTQQKLMPKVFTYTRNCMYRQQTISVSVCVCVCVGEFEIMIISVQIVNS